MPHHHEDSSSSESSHSRRSSRRSRNGNRLKYEGSSCGIRSVNEYQDKFCPRDHPDKTAQASRESENSRARADAKATNHGNGHFSSSASAGASAVKEGDLSLLDTNAKADAEFGLGGAIAGAEANATYFNLNDNNGANLDVAKGYVGGEVGIGAGGAKAMVEAGVDAVASSIEFGEGQAVEAALGVNANTGAEIGVDGVSASFLGVGFSIGRTTGISLPFGRFNIKLW